MRKFLSFLMFSLLVFSVSYGKGLPSYKTICSKLPSISGWTVSSCSGANVETNMGKAVTATKDYEKGNKKMHVSVVGGMQANMYSGSFSHMQIETEKGFIKTMTVDGFKVSVTHSKKDNSGSIAVLLKSASQNSAVLLVNYENMNWKEALELSKRLNWKGLAEMF